MASSEPPGRLNRPGVWMALAALAALSVLIAWGPRWAMERAWSTHRACLRAIEQGEYVCSQDFSFMLSLAGLAPWRSGQAKSDARMMQEEESRARLKQYAARELDPRLVEGEARKLLELAGAESRQPEGASVLLQSLEQAAAWSTLKKHPELARRAGQPWGLFWVAVGHGDWKLADELATVPERHPMSFWEGQRAAWLCLRGHREAAIDILRQSESSERTLAACVGEPVDSERLTQDVEWADEVIMRSKPGTSLERLLPRTNDGRARTLMTPFLADWILGAHPEPEIVVNVAGRVLQGQFVLPERAVVDPKRLLEAAALTRELKEQVPSQGYPEIAPDDPQQAAWWGDADAQAAREEPAQALGIVATTLTFHAALGSARLHDAELFKQALERLPVDVKREYAILLALAARDSGALEEAIELAKLAGEHDSAEVRAVGHTLRAELLLSHGQLQKARSAADEAETALRLAEQDNSVAQAAFMHSNENLAWVQMALALHSDTEPKRKVALPDFLWAQHLTDAELPKDWFTLAQASERVRREARASMRPLTHPNLRTPVSQVLVAAYVGREGDQELWLDQLFDATMRTAHQPLFLRARAAAARLRGEPDTERHWVERAERLESLRATPRSTILAQAAGR